jgi:hypothetical protein
MTYRRGRRLGAGWVGVGAIALLCAIDGCWTGAAVETQRPTEQQKDHRPLPFDAASEQSDPLPGPTTVPSAKQRDLGLEDRLRDGGPSLMPSLVNGPVVAIDVDAGWMFTFCGERAAQAASAWGARFADRSRPKPVCVFNGSEEVRCGQIIQHDWFEVTFAGRDSPHIRVVVMGDMRKRGRYFRQLRQEIQNAACP